MKSAKERTEKCVGERNRINPLHCRIRYEVWINEEEHRHIDRFPSIQFLLLETKALDLAEVRRNLARRNTICCNPNNVRRSLIRGRVKCKRCLPGKNSDFALLRCEFPR